MLSDLVSSGKNAKVICMFLFGYELDIDRIREVFRVLL